jgi:hypothetical protein
VCQACGTKLAVVKMAATEPTQSMRFMLCGYVVGALAWFRRVYRAVGLMLRSSVVLHDSWWSGWVWCCPFKGHSFNQFVTKIPSKTFAPSLSGTMLKFQKYNQKFI